MRTSSIYTLSIAICLAESYSLIVPIKLRMETIIEDWQICPLPHSVLRIYLNRIILTAADNTARLATWLTVSMSLIRVAVLRKNIPDNQFQMLSAPAFGWLLSFFLFVPSFVLSLTRYFKEQIDEIGMWRPHFGCESVTVAESLIQYTLIPSDLYTFENGIFEKFFVVSNGFLSYLVPSVLLSIFIVFLLYEIFLKSRKERLSVSASAPGTDPKNIQYRNEQTTKLVALLSIFMLFLSLCHSAIFISQLAINDDNNLIKISTATMTWLFAVNSASRCFLFALFSGRYRNAGIRQKKSSTNSNQGVLTYRPRSVSSMVPPASLNESK
uniref:G_PROTEIN_RECEP_F1_2 domain-containing protein n=1 Tax=Caenorhabditis japonica TaxID=281687 RepID=A0A8R1DWL9_CAEJA